MLHDRTDYTKNTHDGFTLFEMAITVGILSIILSIAMTSSFSAVSSTGLRTADNILVQTMRRAQTLSQQNAHEADTSTGQWGVYICEGDGNTDCDPEFPKAAVVLFEGDDFQSIADSNYQAFEINPNITMSGALYYKMIDKHGKGGGTKKGLVFSRFLGDPVEGQFSGAIILQMGTISRSVNVNGKGVVER